MPSSPRAPVAGVEQLIRASARSVFNAFVEPSILKKFWLSKASGPLKLGKTVHWDFKVRGASDRVKVLLLDPGQRIRVQWSDRSITEWTFIALSPKSTLVRVEQTGFPGTREAVVAAAIDSVQGFTFVLSDLKVLLEHGIRSHIVKDKARVIERAMRQARRKA